MNTQTKINSIPVFFTLKEAIRFIRMNFDRYKKSLFIPGLLILAINLIITIQINNEPSSFLWVTFIILLLTNIIVMNISFRTVLLGDAGHVLWSGSETRTLIKIFGMTLIMTLIAWVAALPFFLIIFLVGLFSAINIEYINFIAFLGSALIFYVMSPYLLARMIFIYPATAIGLKLKFKEAIQLSRGQGWRIIALVAIPLSLNIIFGLFFIFFRNPFYQYASIIPNTVIGLIVTLVWTTSIAMAYQNIKMQTDEGI